MVLKIGYHIFLKYKKNLRDITNINKNLKNNLIIRLIGLYEENTFIIKKVKNYGLVKTLFLISRRYIFALNLITRLNGLNEENTFIIKKVKNYGLLKTPFLLVEDIYSH